MSKGTQSEFNFTIFRKNIRTLRRASSEKSSNEVSKEMKLKSVKRLADLEGEGRGIPSLDEVITIANYYKVPIDTLLKKEIKLNIEVDY
jgi:transcriptional regulator with XRE-family HTH domain